MLNRHSTQNRHSTKNKRFTHMCLYEGTKYTAAAKKNVEEQKKNFFYHQIKKVCGIFIIKRSTSKMWK